MAVSGLRGFEFLIKFSVNLIKKCYEMPINSYTKRLFKIPYSQAK